MPNQKTHPDDLVTMLAELAASHGYGISNIRLIGLSADAGLSLPVHEYVTSFVEVADMDGKTSAAAAS